MDTRGRVTCRVTSVVLATVLVAAGLLRSHLWPLVLLALLGALAGLVLAWRTHDARDLRRLPTLVALAVLVLVGVGQLGVLGLILGLLLLVTVPASTGRS